MSDLDVLADWLGISFSEATDLLDALAWVRQQREIRHRGYASDLPRESGGLVVDAELARELLEVAQDFELATELIEALQRRAEL